MGGSLNRCTIINETDVPIFIMTYSCSNVGYWFHRDHRQVPMQSELGHKQKPVEVTGLAGGRKVYVAVMYNISEKTRRTTLDIFTVAHGATLTIQGITGNSGVTKYDEVEGVQMHTKGQMGKMSKEMAQWMGEIAKNYGGPLLKKATRGAVNLASPLIADLLDEIFIEIVKIYNNNNDKID